MGINRLIDDTFLLIPSPIPAAPPQSGQPHPVWIDTDATFGIPFRDKDDILSLLQAFGSPELAIRGISVTFGNIKPDDVEPVRGRLSSFVGQFAPTSIPVYSGARSAADFGYATNASIALAAALRRERLLILMQGPATMVATVIKLHPELVPRIIRIIAVAGRRPGEEFRPGKGWIALRDLNFDSDTQAFAELLSSGVPITLVPFEIGNKVWITISDLENIRRSGKGGAWFAEQRESWGWLDIWTHLIGVTGFNAFDSLAVAYLTSPQLFGVSDQHAGYDWREQGKWR